MIFLVAYRNYLKLPGTKMVMPHELLGDLPIILQLTYYLIQEIQTQTPHLAMSG